MQALCLLFLFQHRSFSFEHGPHSYQQIGGSFLSNSHGYFLICTCMGNDRYYLADIIKPDASPIGGNLGSDGLRTQDFQLHNSKKERLITHGFPSFIWMSVPFHYHHHLLSPHILACEDKGEQGKTILG